MKFKLKGLPKNQKWFEVKKSFFEFGYVSDFFYKQDGTADITFGNLANNKKQQFLDYCREHNIEVIELNSLSRVNNHKTTSKNDNIQNPSYNYYKDATYGKNLERFVWTDKYNYLLKIDGADMSLRLTTIYPGLLVGSGYNHPIKKGDDDAYQLGFFFDHTTGLPLISGSSIKGVIRSIFKDNKKFKYLQEAYKINEEKDSIVERLFESGTTIFYDAYIIGTDNKDKEGNSIIFGSDYITSHYSNDSLGQYRDPNPIKFLKILSEVTWQFQFKAQKSDIELFKKIILDFGLGAKTNVGYGKFRD